MNIVLWIVQALLAFIFLFSGASKFVMSVDEMNAQAAFPFSLKEQAGRLLLAMRTDPVSVLKAE